MIDTSIEQAIPLSLAAREIPNRRGDRGVNVATIWRWMQRGIRGIKLETILIGGQRMTTREAMRRFFAATTEAADGRAPSPAPSLHRQKQIEAAERELADAGI
jgi:hypothetical protein